jgi:hypothetical protein
VFTLHLNELVNAASKALNDIKHLNKLSLTTGIKLFQLKVNPVATYGLEDMGTPKEEATRKVREVKSNLPKKKHFAYLSTPSHDSYMN